MPVELEHLNGRWAGLYILPENRPDSRKTDGESDFTVYAVEEHEQFKISGKGYDRAGHFDFEGHVKRDGGLYFKKKYHAHWWHYKGILDPDTNTMSGRWGEGQKGGGGFFAFHLAEVSNDDAAQQRLHLISGPWTGHRKRLPENRLTWAEFDLHVTKGTQDRKYDQLSIKGQGQDQYGHFSVLGCISAAGQVAFAKMNHDSTIALYRGTLNDSNDYIEGYYRSQRGHGTFIFDHP